MTNVFEERNTKQSKTLMELRPKSLVNASDWYAWGFYLDIVPLHVKNLHTLIKDLDDKLDEKEADVCKCNLIDWVVEYRERRQAFLFCVDFMLSLTKEETQRQLSRSVTEWEECFAKLESSWGYWFPDVIQMLKCPIDGTSVLKLSKMENDTSTDAAMRCPRTRELMQKRVDQTKQNCIKKVDSENQSLMRSRRTNQVKSLSPLSRPLSLLEESGQVSHKTIQMDSRTTISSKESTEKRLVPLALEKAVDEKLDEIQDQRSEAGSLQIKELGKHS